MSKQIILSEEQWELIKGTLREATKLVEHVICEKPNAFRPALELSKSLTQCTKQVGIDLK